MEYLTKTRRPEGDDLKPAQRLNFIDRAITLFNPNYGLKAMQARQMLHYFGYNDTPTRRGVGGLIGTTTGESWIRNRDRLKMMQDARDAACYDWIGGVVAKIVLYVCGTIHASAQTGDPEVNAMYDEYFHNWCGDERSDDGFTICDITGRHRFSKMVQIALLAFLVDGDHGLIEIDPRFSPTGRYCLQHNEADRLGSPLDPTTNEDYIGGVKIDVVTGRVLFYRTYTRTRSGQYINPTDIAPNDYIHVVDQIRSDEYRGRSKLMPLLNDLRDIREWVEAEKIAGKTQSQWAALVGTKDPFNNTGPAAWEGQTKEGTPTQEAIWGKILKASEGESFAMLSPSSRPTGAFMAFVQMLIRKMSVSLGLPYGFLWDLAALGGVTARIEVEGALRQIQYWQKNILESLILNRVRQKVIAEGITLGALPPHPNWKLCQWHFGKWITTDAGYEMQNDVLGMQTGIISIAEVTAKYDKTPTEVFNANATAANEALTVGENQQLPVEVIAKGLFPDITEQTAALRNPTPPPKPGSIDAIGDKGVGKLIDLIQGVKDLTIDRESCINTLMNSFGLTRAKAESITPKEPTKAELDAEAERNRPAVAPGKPKVSKPAPKKK
jgi:capsid protein